MVKKWKVSLPQLTGSKRRNAYIYLPVSYKTERRKHYPVLYMFDGHNVFFDEDATYGKSWGMKEYLDNSDTELIVAAAECNHSPDGGRLSEYCPFDFEMPGFGHIEGRGHFTMNWFVNTFKPYVDRYYRTIPDREHTFIAGSSMGGLMSLYALLHYNNVYSRAAALSPSLWTSPDTVREMIQSSDPAPGTVLYMDYGSRELEYREGMYSAWGEASRLLLDKEIFLTSRIVPDGQHCEASWEKQLPFAINTLMYNLK